jgi:hypothetical protein
MTVYITSAIYFVLLVVWHAWFIYALSEKVCSKTTVVIHDRGHYIRKFVYVY